MPIGSKGEGAGGGGATTYDALTDTAVSKVSQKGAVSIVNEAEDALIYQSVALSAGMLEKPTFSIAGTNLTINADGIAQIYNSTGVIATISRHTVAGQVISLASLTNGQAAQVLVRDNAGTIEYFLNTGAKSDEIVNALAFAVTNINGNFEADRFDNAYSPSNFMINRIQETDRIKRLESGGGLIISNPTGSQIEISSGILYVGIERRNLALVNTSVDASLLFDGVGGSTVITGWNNTQFVDSGGNLQTLTSNRYAINWVFRVVSDESNTARIVVLLGGGDHQLNAAQEEDAPTYSVDFLNEFAELVGKIIIQKDASVETSIEQITGVGGGGGFTTNDHNSLSGLNTGDFRHLSAVEKDDLSGGDLGNLTEGSVIFMGPNGVAQAATSFFWDNANKRFGIGTPAPIGDTHVFANDVRVLFGRHDGAAGRSCLDLYFAGGAGNEGALNFFAGLSKIAAFKIKSGGGGALIVTMASGTEVWKWTSTGHFEPVTDLTFNIGSAVNRVAEAFVGTVRLGPSNLDLQALLDSKDSFLDSFGPNDVTFPSSSPSALSRNERPTLDFAEGVDKSVIRHNVLSSGYRGAGTNLKIEWAGKISSSGDVVWGVEVERVEPGVTDIDSDSFAAQRTVIASAPATGKTVISTISLTQAQADGWEKENSYRMRLSRVGTNGNDTMTGDAQILNVWLVQ